MSTTKKQPSPLVAAVQRLTHAGSSQAIDLACAHFLDLGAQRLRRHCRTLVRLHHAEANYGALELACDAVADAALALRRQPVAFPSDAAVVAYLKTCASRLVLRSAVRGGDRWREFGVDVAGIQEHVQEPLWATTVPRTSRDMQIRSAYIRALRTLPQRQRQVLRLVLERGYTLEEVHWTLGLSVSTAYRAKRDGLLTLRVRLLPFCAPTPPRPAAPVSPAVSSPARTETRITDAEPHGRRLPWQSEAPSPLR